MGKGTRSERRAYEQAKATGQLGTTVVYASRPATDAQMQLIELLARRRGYRFVDDAIKAALGKRPVGGLNRERASRVIEFLGG
jgi:hypothetical protein